MAVLKRMNWRGVISNGGKQNWRVLATFSLRDNYRNGNEETRIRRYRI